MCGRERLPHTAQRAHPAGALVRDPSAWARYLTETLGLFADDTDVVFSSHHWPTWGQGRAVRFLEEQRDAYAFLHVLNAAHTTRSSH